MSDFLTSLAARALAPPSLRPRTRSRFEPVVAAPAEIGASAGAAPPARERGPAAEPAPVVIADPPQTQPPAVERRAREEAQEPARPKAIAIPEAPPSPSLPVATSPSRETAGFVDKPVPQPSVTPVVSTRRAPAPPEVRTETIIETREVILRESAAPPPSAARPPLPALRHRHDEQPPRIEPPLPPREVRLATSQQRSVRVAAVQPRGESPATSEPVIHVSIGRVEVRAVTPPPASKPGRAPRAAMTIDDYVARRNGKGRP